ncbi:excalibur calcium-binding domain-containing protein [Paenibacillus glycanilyticus]|uniref:excalibur calcium-binding domain-containing protein n=1 Tax=Paenibacillus glycanilyticus TaxID=126569 RepID=UPI0024E0E6A0|nr:excalibur calcium-binding domain-containing protein [Paenibacillus glycanilyticus]
MIDGGADGDVKPTSKSTSTKSTSTKSTDTKIADTKIKSSSVTYRNCSEVRAAGKNPLHASDPGYSRQLDGDGDGVACEN